MSRMGRTTQWFIAAAIGIAVLGASGCWLGKPPKTAAQSRPISTAEGLEFGKGLANAFMILDAKQVDEGMDVMAMMDIATEGVTAPFGFRRNFFKGVKQTQDQNGNLLIRELRPAVEAGANIVATRGMTWEGKPAVILRISPPEGGASYIVFLLERRPDGHIRATDYYSLLSGELGSQTCRRLYVSGVAHANRGLIDKLMGKEYPLAKHIKDLTRMATANREGRPEETLTIYDGLPEAVKAEKSFVLLRFHAAQKLGDDAKYLEAMQDFARRFPGDPACDFLLLDAYILQDQPEKALEGLDRLEKFLGEDAYLKVTRGNILTLLKRPDDARAAYRTAIADEPDLRPAYDGLLAAALDQKRFGEVVEMLDALQELFDEEIGDLSESEDFTEFLASPEGKAWAEKHEMQKPEDDASKPASPAENPGPGRPGE